MNNYSDDIKAIQKILSKLYQDLSEVGYNKNVFLTDAVENMSTAHLRMIELQKEIEKRGAGRRFAT